VDAAGSWKAIFENWPEAVPRQGMVVTSYAETIPFVNFLISPGVVMLERDKPDTLGARKVMVTYTSISAVKLASPMELARFQVMGFQAPF
jgi:hypothetical protein